MVKQPLMNSDEWSRLHHDSVQMVCGHKKKTEARDFPQHIPVCVIIRSMLHRGMFRVLHPHDIATDKSFPSNSLNTQLNFIHVGSGSCDKASSKTRAV